MLPVTRRQNRRYDDPVDMIRREFDRLFSPAGDAGGEMAGLGDYPVDIHEDEQHVYVEAELPGFKKDEISVELDEGVLSITAERRPAEKKGRKHLEERRYTRVQRTFTLPAHLEDSDAEASFKDGVLYLTLKKSNQARRRRISVK